MSIAQLESDIALTQSNVETLQTQSDELQIQSDKVKQDLDILTTRLISPGGRFLIDLEYQTVYAAQIVIDTSSTSRISIDTLPGELHAVYQLSAYATTNTPIILMDGASLGSLTDLGSLTNGVSVCLLRQRASDPTRIEIYLNVINSIASPQTLAIKVWRRLGIGS